MKKTLAIFAAVTVLLALYAHVERRKEVRTSSGKDAAIETVIASFPELASYRTSSLPPRAIETKESSLGWHVGFIGYGSGLPGVLEARCYLVDKNMRVTETGAFTRTEGVVTYVKLETCEAVYEVNSGSGTQRGNMKVALPPGASTMPISDADISVSNEPPAEPRAPMFGGCYRGGCSGQICSEDPEAASTCEYRPEYACYGNARCERQASGECGWTMTEDLRACISGGAGASMDSM